MKINVEIIPSFSIAYIREIGAYGEKNYHTMEKLKQWAKENNLMNSSAVILGIAHDNPQTALPESCSYDACIILSNERFETTDTVKHGQITGGKYAVFTIAHTAEAVRKAWTEIFPALEKENFALDISRPIMERYASKLADSNLCEICVPII